MRNREESGETWLTVRVEPELKKRLARIAAREARNLSDLSRLFLEFAVQQHKRAGSYDALKEATLTMSGGRSESPLKRKK